MVESVIYNKLEALRRCVARIESKTPSSAAELSDDFDLQDIISVNLERAIQMCIDIASHLIAEQNEEVPTTMAGCFERLTEMKVISAELSIRLKKAVSFRNVAVHAYEKIDWNIVYSIITKNLSDFKMFGHYVVAIINAP